MHYVREWEPIATCLQRLIKLGLPAEDAKSIICDLISAKKVGLRLILAADQKRLLTETIVPQDRIELPARLGPADFDWKKSCPSRALLKRWSFIPPRTLAEPVTLYIARCGDLIERNIESIELAAPELIGIVSTDTSAVEKNNSEVAQSGVPGRPTSKHLVSEEFRRRMQDDKVEKPLSKEAEALSRWLSKKYPLQPQMAARSVENTIRAEYRKKYGNARNQK